MRRRHSLFTVEGEKAVRDMLGRFPLEALIIRETASQASDWHGVDTDRIFTAKSDMMDRLGNFSAPSDVMAVFRLPEAAAQPHLRVEKDLYVALDGIQDPGNLGTIIRTCHWFGIYHIFASRDTADLYNPKTLQSAMGSIGHVEVTYCDLTDLFRANPEMPVYGTLFDGEDIFAASLGDSGFIVMGNEGKGLSAEIRRMVTHALLIPPYSADHSESLNVSVATAIVVAQFRK